MKSQLIEKLAMELPPIIVRANVYKLTGGLISPKTLSNADSIGLGPKEKEIVAHKIVYSKEAFMEWLSRYFKTNRGEIDE